MTTKHVPLCQTKGCPHPSDPDFHVPVCGHGLAYEHHHTKKRSRGGALSVQVCICPRCHHQIDNGPWMDGVYDHGNGTIHYFIKDAKGEDKCDVVIGQWKKDERVIEAAPRSPGGETLPVVKEEALPAIDGLLNLDADYSGLDDDALVAIYEQAVVEAKAAYLIRCKAVDAYRAKNELRCGKRWAEEAREKFGRSECTLRAQSNFWLLYEATCTSARYLADDMGQLSEQLGLIQLIGRKSVEEAPKYLEAAITLMAETGEPPTPAHVKNKLKADVRAAQVTGPGKATVYQQDALDFLESLNPESVDLLLTDPPYMTDVEDIATFAQSWVPLALSRIKPSGRAYIFTGAYPRELHAYLSVLLDMPAFTFDNVLVWTYRNTLGPSPSHDYKLNWQSIFYLYGPAAPPLDCPSMLEQFTVQDIRAPDARLGDRYHAWQKPDDLAERLIQHSTQPNELIADPFVGTGTFLAAALRLGRIAVGSEINGAMLALCRERGLEVKDAG